MTKKINDGLTIWQRYYRKHKDVILKKKKVYVKTHRKELYEYRRKYYQRIKEELFNLLGSKCCKCGYSGLALQIDHINNDGYKLRKENNRGTRGSNLDVYLKIRKEVLSGSKKYQLLCANCNVEKELKRRMK